MRLPTSLACAALPVKAAGADVWPRPGSACCARRLVGQAPPLRLPLSQRADEPVHEIGIELASGTIFQIQHRPLGRPRVAIGTLGAERVVDVADMHEATGHRALALVVQGGIPS